ncbi:methyl-accepting chemotaxis protein [Photobacterium nomapromontoriensis]|uniref:methyl-accepting chemotaxis protein n=1 Tax=Photobacterium nomapromontoriensis TaxID=2910237 RepID=UPI003D14DE01
MMKLNQFSFGKRLGAGFAVIIFLMVVVFAEGLRARNVIDNGIQQLNAANIGVREVFGLQVLENNYLNTRDPIYAERFKKWHKVNLDNFKQSSGLFNSNENRPLVKQFELSSVAYGEDFDVFNQQIATVQQLNKQLLDVETRWAQRYADDASLLLLSKLQQLRSQSELSLDPEHLEQWLRVLTTWNTLNSDDLIKDYRSYFDQMSIQIQASVQSRASMLAAATEVRDSAKFILANVEKQMAKDKQISFYISIAVCCAALAICFLIGLVLTRSVTLPIRKIIAAVEQLAKGDLDQQLVTDGNDELASLSMAINQMTISLRHMVEDINQTAGILNTETLDMSRIADENHAGANKQAAESELIAAAMSQMTATMSEIQNSVKEVASSSESSLDLIGNCTQVTQVAINDMQQLETTVSGAVSVVKQLAEGAGNIGSVLDVINQISEQTNLLALNAAIEAARAGEQGRGFAVVADEVRLLAQRTQSSTHEIKTMIESLNHHASQAVTVMAESQQSAMSTCQQVNEIGHHLQQVSDHVNNVVAQSLNLSQALAEQHTTTQSLDVSMTVIVEVSRHSADTASQLAQTANQLTQCKDEITQHMARFHLSSSLL